PRSLRRGLGRGTAARDRCGQGCAGGPARRPAAARRQPRPRGWHDARRSSAGARRRGRRAQRLPHPGAHRVAGPGSRFRGAAQRAARAAREPRDAVDGGRAARSGVGRCELQGAAARAHAGWPAGETHRRPVRHAPALPRLGRRLRRRYRCGLLAPAGAECDRQLDQDRAARAGAHRARCARGGGTPAADRAFHEGRRGRERRHRRRAPAAARPGLRGLVDGCVRFRQCAGERPRAGDHRRQPVRPGASVRRGACAGRARRGRSRPARECAACGYGAASAPLKGRAAHALRMQAMSAENADRPVAGGAPGGAPAGLPPLTGSTLAIGTIALSLATFKNVLDTSIANVSIPAIAGDLGVSPDQGTWVITSFGVANAISLPLTGWLTQRYGQVRLFMASVLLFVIASVLCALAPSLAFLVVFRVIQGAVAGPMIPLSQALLLSSYPKEKSGAALAIWAITTLVAPVVGPLLGGWITDNISWPWIFYINVPVGLVAAGVTWMIYSRRETPTHRLPVDGVGLGLLVLWI